MVRVRSVIIDNSTSPSVLYFNTDTTSNATASQKITQIPTQSFFIDFVQPGIKVATTSLNNAPYIRFPANSTINSVVFNFANSTGGTLGASGAAVNASIFKIAANGFTSSWANLNINSNTTAQTFTASQLTALNANLNFSVGDRLSARITVRPGIAPSGLRLYFNYFNQQ